MVNRIADLGFNHSEIPDTAEYLADQIGGRMTNSPAMRRAERWATERFNAWGLKNVRTEGFDFGRGCGSRPHRSAWSRRGRSS